MGANSVQCCNVGETELAKGGLKDRDPMVLTNFLSGGAVDGLDDLIDVGRNEGIY
jgi:hypothetical protein